MLTDLKMSAAKLAKAIPDPVLAKTLAFPRVTVYQFTIDLGNTWKNYGLAVNWPRLNANKCSLIELVESAPHNVPSQAWCFINYATDPARLVFSIERILQFKNKERLTIIKWLKNKKTQASRDA